MNVEKLLPSHADSKKFSAVLEQAAGAWVVTPHAVIGTVVASADDETGSVQPVANTIERVANKLSSLIFMILFPRF